MSAIVLFNLGYTLVLLIYGWRIESPLAGLYTAITVGLLVLFGILNRYVRWSRPTLWLASVVGLGNMLGGVILIGDQPLYMTEVIGPIAYDKVFHTFAAFGMAFIAWEAVLRWSGAGANRAGLLLLTWLVVMGGGAVVEIAELIGSQMSGVSVGDYLNNALDLVANGLGAACGVLVIALFGDRIGSRRETRHDPSPAG